MNQEFAGALAPAKYVNSDHPAIVAFARAAAAGAEDDVTRAVQLYYAVRDRFRYDPYNTDFSEAGLRANRVLEDGFGWCVPKAALLAAACRVVGVPARVGFADVRNHLSTARMRESMGTDIFYFHGYTSIYLGGAWRKATPAFNIELCHKLGLHPLEFDGAADSIYHPYDLTGRRHMEYLALRGEFDDVPREELVRVLAEKYPNMQDLLDADWDADIAAEAAGG